MNLKSILVIIVAVAIVLTIIALLLYRSPGELVDEFTTPLSETPTVTTNIVSNATTTPPPFRTKPLTPTQTTFFENVCEIDVLKITPVIRSSIVIQDQSEVMIITGYIRIERVVYEEGVNIYVKQIVIDNPTEYSRRGYFDLAAQLYIQFEDPKPIPYTYSIRIETLSDPVLYELLKPGTKHTVTVTYLYNNIACSRTIEVTMLSS